MSYFITQVGQEKAITYGVRGERNTTQINRYTKDGLKGRSVTHLEVLGWSNSIHQLLEKIEQDFLERQVEMLDPLHDPIRLAKQVNTIANRLVQTQSRGSSFEQQIDNASFELKTLVKASDLLSDSFDLLSIYFNPHAATFGRKSAINLHGLLLKLIAIFRIDDGGITRSSTKIYISGSCYRNVFLYESFKLIPFALLSNAVKYSLQGNIEVVLEDRRQYIELTVTSIGPPIDEDEKEKIFQKRGRGRWAEKKAVDGRGVGLYLAQIIANAHGTKISVSSAKTGDTSDGIPLARNIFSIQIAAA
ncbi:ATP-binding protein [Comamonas sp. CMM03]|uniref:ATP-binding protein n=1 Tax=Comamonas sp. CMM03 TaxID=2854781 RepID=UPI001C456F85|nr:ATP-binding protein [Comamonas sp. CMM03]MBV7418463.1 ATP-binding protein [Comamonas sp. CMM03]